jgi:penicillin-binding protein 2
MSIAEDRRRVTFRLQILQVAAIVVFIVLGMGFWFLQVIEHKRYEELAENNHQRTLALRAPRGVLFDRSGTVLVENRHSFTISIVREHSTDLGRTVKLLSQVAGLTPADVEQIVARHRNEPAYRPIVIVEDASLAQVAAVRARRLESELPDVVVEEVPTRRYPVDAMAAHLFGYVGEANDSQVAAGATQGAIIGQQGLESTAWAARFGRSKRCRPSRAGGCSSRSTPTCSARPRTDSAMPASTGPPWCWTRGTAKC